MLRESLEAVVVSHPLQLSPRCLLPKACRL
jgi:hypothetical protein